MGFREDVTIDKDALDEEWLKLALKECDWGEAEARAEEEFDILQNKLTLKKAELDGLIRACPSLYGIEKISENAVGSAILKDVAYQELVSENIQANKNTRMMKVARKAMSRHEKALDRITDLYLSNYWAREIPQKKVDKASENMEHRRFNEHMEERNNRKLRRKSSGGDGNADNQ
jgi:hypothetical protein